MDKADVECFELFDGVRWEQDKPVGHRSLGVYWATTGVGAALDFLLDMGDGIPEVWTKSGDGSLERFAVSRKDGGYCVKSLGGPEEFSAEIKAKIDDANVRLDRSLGDKPLAGKTRVAMPFEEFMPVVDSVFEPRLKTEGEVREAVEAYLGLMPRSLSGCWCFQLTSGGKRFRGCWMVLRDFDGVLVDPHDAGIRLLRKRGKSGEWQIMEFSHDNRERVKRCFEEKV